MKWDNLTQNKCPKCSGELYGSGDYIKCGKCSFHISEQKMKQICSNVTEQKLSRLDDEEERNQAELNNL